MEPKVKDRIKAVVYHAPRDVRVEEIPRPACGEGEIRVAVDACAVCGSDLKAWLHGNPRIKPPMVMGHEFTGVVETPGDGFAPGDRVVMATSISCGECVYCGKGWPNLCARLAPMGFSFPGGMAGAVTIPALALRRGHVVKVPAGIPAVSAALAEPVSCAVNACETSGVREGDAVVVVGAGPMGIINACVARAFGARRVILAEVNERRLRQGAEFGLDVLVNPAAQDLAKIVRDETGGVGADVVIVTAPAARPQEESLALARKRGTVCLFASLPEGKHEIALNSRLIHYGELRVVGSSDSTPAHVRRALELIGKGAVPANRLASHRMGLDQVHEAFKLMERGEALRVVLEP
jgi:L-iditol 2-dehydrogenase